MSLRSRGTQGRDVGRSGTVAYRSAGWVNGRSQQLPGVSASRHSGGHRTSLDASPIAAGPVLSLRRTAGEARGSLGLLMGWMARTCPGAPRPRSSTRRRVISGRSDPAWPHQKWKILSGISALTLSTLCLSPKAQKFDGAGSSFHWRSRSPQRPKGGQCRINALLPIAESWLQIDRGDVGTVEQRPEDELQASATRATASPAGRRAMA